MNNNTPGIPDHLRLKFPDLRPVKHPPTLIRINGIGLGMYGRRDYDQETNTYVKTYCICVVFVPILALAAYRVANADRGWYFIGKERLSSFAKSCNFGILLLSLMFAGILAEKSYKTSPDYLARQEIRHAQEALKSGKPLEAARIYREVALGTTLQAEPARQDLHEALAQSLTNDSPDNLEAAFRLLAGLPGRINSPEPLVPNAYERGMALVRKLRGTNPDGAVGLLRQVAALGGGTNAASIKPLEMDLLKAAIAANPDNTNRVVELALIYEEQKQFDPCYQLLSPYRQKLGATEGARILGQHLIEERQYEDAYGLLYPYVQTRLERLHSLERNYTNAMAAVSTRSIEDLNHNLGDPSFYDAYKRGSKTEKQALVNSYVRKRMDSDPGVKRAIADMTTASQVVHVTLDLGMVQLNRAQNLADAAARKTELEAAEKTFLAIRGLAGDTDEYRLFLGQVYYWLGRSTEGGELFAQLLASHKRACPLLLRLAQTLRAVGEEGQARDLAEEAYRTAKSDKDKFSAAALRALLKKTQQEEIAWLEKSDPGDASIQIQLNCARGDKALQDGNRELAAQLLRKAIDGYENMPRNAVLMNNCGLAYLDLYYATGNLADHDHGLALLEQSMALSPGDSILLLNVADLLITRAYMDVVGDAIRFAALKTGPDYSMLHCLYADEQSRAAVMEQLRQNEHMKKALAYLDKALLLAPKNPGLYAISMQLQQGFRDLGELQKLQQRMRIAAPDMSELVRNTREAYDPAKDKERLDRIQNELRRYQGLLASAAVKDHPLTRGFVETELNGLQQQAGLAGAVTDSQQLLDQAAAIHHRQPTSSSLLTLIAAHFYRAEDELKQQSGDYARLVEQTRRAMAPRDRIAFLLGRNDPRGAIASRNTNVLKAVELMKQNGLLFPSFRQPDEWALFRAIDPDEAAVVTRQLRGDTVSRLADDLLLQLDPISSTAVLRRFWIDKLNGDDSGAAALYQQALRDGVPLPPL